MRRLLSRAPLVAALILLVAVVLSGAGLVTMAQTATPPATPATAPAATPSVEVIAQSEAARSRAETVTMTRVELAPGAETGLITADGNRILYVLEGTIRFRVESGKVSLGEPSGPARGKPIKADTWIDVDTGESLIVSRNATYEYRNDGDVLAVVLASGGSDATTEGCGGGCS